MSATCGTDDMFYQRIAKKSMSLSMIGSLAVLLTAIGAYLVLMGIGGLILSLLLEHSHF